MNPVKLLARLLDRIPFMARPMSFARMKYKTRRFMKAYYTVKKIDRKLVMFEAFGGKAYSCNPRALYEEMINDPEWNDYQKVWSFINPEAHKKLEDNPNTKVIKFGSDEYYRLLTGAGCIITNFRLPREFVKKPGQFMFQTWHGVPLKKLGYDIKHYREKHVSSEELTRQYDLSIKQTSAFLSASPYFTRCITTAFELDRKKRTDIIWEMGYPRNDSLYRINDDKIDSIKQRLGISKDKKVVLYCPTYRDDQSAAGKGHTYELGVDFDLVRRYIGTNVVILFRLHYLVNSVFDFSKYTGFIYDVSREQDINELYMISDMLITDYSSVMYDFAILNRPLLLYMYDYDNYKNNLRDFYMDMNELPGETVYNQKELIEKLKDFSNDSYHFDTERMNEFNNIHNVLNGADTSHRILNRIYENLNPQVIEEIV